MNDELINQIVAGTDAAARRALLNLLIEAENIWANFDVVCHEPQRCRSALTLSHLFELRRTLAASLVACAESLGERPAARACATAPRRPT